MSKNTKNSKKIDTEIKFWGINYTSKDLCGLLDDLKVHLKSSRKVSYIVTPNPEQIIQARENRAFNQSLLESDIAVADGVGIVWAHQLLSFFKINAPKLHKIGGVDLVAHLLQVAAQNEYRVLIVGGRGYDQTTSVKSTEHRDIGIEISKRVKNNYKNSCPEHEFDGSVFKPKQLLWTPAYENVLVPSSAEEAAVTALIASFKPQLVFVAFGAPQQELWIVEHKDVLEQAGTTIVMAVGGSFDFILGKVKRAPGWVRALGMEWLFRLGIEPWRWRRQRRLVSFIKLVLLELFRVFSPRETR